jgi:hypothetical protein
MPIYQHIIIKLSSQQMTYTQQALRLDVLIRDDTHQCWHKDGDDALYGIEPGYLGSETCRTEVIPHTGQVGTPDGKLQEVHQCQTHFYIHSCSFKIIDAKLAKTLENAHLQSEFFAFRRILHAIDRPDCD